MPKAILTFTHNGKEHQVTRASFYPTKDIFKEGIQGTLSVEIDNLFYIRLKVTNFMRDGQLQTAIFGPSQQYEDNWYTQADFSSQAKREIEGQLIDLALRLYKESLTPQQANNAFVQGAEVVGQQPLQQVADVL